MPVLNYEEAATAGLDKFLAQPNPNEIRYIETYGPRIEFVRKTIIKKIVRDLEGTYGSSSREITQESLNTAARVFAVNVLARETGAVAQSDPAIG